MLRFGCHRCTGRLFQSLGPAAVLGPAAAKERSPRHELVWTIAQVLIQVLTADDRCCNRLIVATSWHFELEVFGNGFLIPVPSHSHVAIPIPILRIIDFHFHFLSIPKSNFRSLPKKILHLIMRNSNVTI